MDNLLNFAATPKGLLLLQQTGAINECVSHMFSRFTKKLQVTLRRSILLLCVCCHRICDAQKNRLTGLKNRLLDVKGQGEPDCEKEGFLAGL